MKENAFLAPAVCSVSTGGVSAEGEIGTGSTGTDAFSGTLTVSGTVTTGAVTTAGASVFIFFAATVGAAVVAVVVVGASTLVSFSGREVGLGDEPLLDDRESFLLLLLALLLEEVDLLVIVEVTGFGDSSVGFFKAFA